jgi:hypothetical protein
MPPKPAEAAKVQPKKETVRINLPPKPTSAPTIKLPTLTAGAPPPTMATAAAAAPARAPAPPQPPSSGSPSSRIAAPAAGHKPGPSSAAPRSVPSGGGELTTLDKALAIAAVVAVLAALAAQVYLKFFLTDTTGS